MIVEDYEDAANSAAELLRLSGHRILITRTGVEALDLASVDPPDVVMLDIGMPSMDGWEVARRLRDQAKGKQAYMIAVTGYGTESDRWKSADSGIDMHLVKPTDPVKLTQLLERIRATLAKHNLLCNA